MDTNDMIAGYTAYTTAEEFGASAQGAAPATITVVTVSSPSCVAFTFSAGGGIVASVGVTHAAGC